MTYNTKLNLSDRKMYQSSGDTLTLSGETIINITDDGILKYNQHPDFTGVTSPYNIDGVLVDKKYVDDKILDVSGDSIYNLTTPASITLGGVLVGTQLTGKTSNEILEELLTPATEPTVTAPSSTFLMGGEVVDGGTYEIGADVDITFNSTFNRGLIDPYYDASGVNLGTSERAGLPNTYRYTGSGLSDELSVILTDAQSVTGYTVLASNTWGGYVSFDAGTNPVRNSKGVQLEPALIAGDSANINRSFTGILPYFYGTSATQPTPSQALIDGGSKTVANSDGTITINYGTVNSEYLWFAIPNASTTKQGWYVTEFNKANIGTISDLFNAHTVLAVNSPSALWLDENYKIYVTNWATSLTLPMQMRNAQQL